MGPKTVSIPGKGDPRPCSGIFRSRAERTALSVAYVLSVKLQAVLPAGPVPCR
jgi:hypothetical protein